MRRDRRRRRARVLRDRVLPVLGTTLALAAFEAPAARAAVPDGFWGMNASALVGHPDPASHLRAIKQLGVDWIRARAPWNEIEWNAPVDGKHTYRWGNMDWLVGLAAAEGLTVRPMAGYSPTWASSDGSKFGPPKDPGEYAAFVEALLLRYGPYGAFWQSWEGSASCETSDCLVRGSHPITHVEIWNEPNLQHFWHGGDPAVYAALFKAAAMGVPLHARLGGVKLVVGGLLTGPAGNGRVAIPDFLDGMRDAEPTLPGLIEQIAVHAYDAQTWVIQSQLDVARSGADAAGMSEVPLVLNENGWVTKAGFGFFLKPVSEDTRAAKLQNIAGRVNYNRTKWKLAGYAPFTWLTREQDPELGEHWFGIGNQDATPKPSANALRDSIQVIGEE